MLAGAKTMHDLLRQLTADLPHLHFNPGNVFSWSPKDNTITYRYESMQPKASAWALLHEVSHANLGHKTYTSDFELVQLEVAAWQHAKSLAKRYHLKIDPEHIQDCLDTYRDWLHRRSTCPQCGTVSIQKDSTHYECFNCHAIWQVSSSRFCRPYRLLGRTSHKKTAPYQVVQDSFQ